jgi:hypothetical protein
MFFSKRDIYEFIEGIANDEFADAEDATCPKCIGKFYTSDQIAACRALNRVGLLALWAFAMEHLGKCFPNEL